MESICPRMNTRAVCRARIIVATSEGLLVRAVRVTIAVLLFFAAAHAQWRAVGPDGGDVRSLSIDPRNTDHILLGTSTGQIYSSNDAGRSWTSWVHLGAADDYVFDHVVFDSSDPNTIYVAAWSVQREDGGVFRTRDAGRSWERLNALVGKSIRAFAQSTSDPRILVAAALDGVYRSVDGGENWTRITPGNNAALRNFESLAIDAHDPDTIYAGTWHLPWKTSDGGRTWHRIKQGIIDDSDVFSILQDRTDPRTVFASACSGIYKSDDAGHLFRKVQGIPGSARRTLVLRQDPNHASVIYAGTTEGLWKSTDGGKSFQLASPSNYIVNDVAIDPRDSKRVLLATDRGGVLRSDDGAKTFHASNTGFAQRRVTSAVVDADGSVTVSVLHDREYGGVFRHGPKDEKWEQLTRGLGAAEVLDLRRTGDGQMLAASTRGVLRWNSVQGHWEPMTVVVNGTRASAGRALRRPRKTYLRTVSTATSAPQIRVNALSVSGDVWFAASEGGVLRSANHQTWTPSALPKFEFLTIAQSRRRVAATTGRKLFLSDNSGANWRVVPIPAYVSRLRALAFANDATLWVATPEGALHFSGSRWEHVLNGLPARELRSISITQSGSGEVIVCTADDHDRPFVSRDGGQHFIAAEPTGFTLSNAFLSGERLYAITAFHGLLIQKKD